MEDETAAKYRRVAQVATVFTPGSPVGTLPVFSGRHEQIMDVVTAAAQPGMHVVLFGERGVGKTSLANVLSEIFQKRDLGNPRSVRINCASDSDFFEIWRLVFRELGLAEPESDLGPEDVRYELERLPDPVLIVVDELDRLKDPEARSLMADTIKTLSDHLVASTLVLVAVADSIDELVADHRSIERALVQVRMPRMPEAELADIVDMGCVRLDMSITSEARSMITRFSEGLPYYTHSLGLYSAQRAIGDDRSQIHPADVRAAMAMAVEKAQHSIVSAYQAAARSPRKDTLFAQVLLACALAPKDVMGFFTSSGVKGPMSVIMKKPYEIPAFARHLKKFTEAERRSVLQRIGEPRKYFYRFENPLLQPFVILSGLASDLITEEQIQELQSLSDEEQPVLGPSDPPNGSGQLF